MLIIVIGLLVLMAIIGTAYVSTARTDRGAAASNSENTEIAAPAPRRGGHGHRPDHRRYQSLRRRHNTTKFRTGHHLYALQQPR